MRKENEHLHKGTLAYKTDMHDRQKTFVEEQKVSNVKRNPFNSKINKESMENATKVREKKKMMESKNL